MWLCRFKSHQRSFANWQADSYLTRPSFLPGLVYKVNNPFWENHAETAATVRAERAFLRRMGGNCESASGAYAQWIGSLTGLFFADHEISNFEQIPQVNREIYQRFFRLLYQEGILFPPSLFETIFISAAHTEADLERTLSVVEQAMGKL